MSYGLPETDWKSLENVDPEDEEHLAWFCEVHAIPKNEVNPYKVSQLKEPTDVYYVCACAENLTAPSFSTSTPSKRLLDGVHRKVDVHVVHLLQGREDGPGEGHMEGLRLERPEEEGRFEEEEA